MMMMVTGYSLLILLLSLFIPNQSLKTDEEFARDFLIKYGFLEVDNSTQLQKQPNREEFEEALLQFRLFYSLPEDTIGLSQDVLTLMHRKRCGVSDVAHMLTSHKRKWNKSLVRWFIGVNDVQILMLTSKAFKIWEAHANIRFAQTANARAADIVITLQPSEHYFYLENKFCNNSMPDAVLGHAYFPEYDGRQVEIHLSNHVPWDLNPQIPSDYGKTSLLTILIHEIGHSLGLHHARNEESIMYSFYSPKFQLSNEDIYSIQELYGSPASATVSNPKTTTARTTTTAKRPNTKVSVTHKTKVPIAKRTNSTISETQNTTKVATKPLPVTDLCQYINKINTFLIMNHKLYIFYLKWVWIIPLDNMEGPYDPPKLITDWVPALGNFTKIDAIYQRPTGEIVVFIGDMVYIITFPDFQIHFYDKFSNLGLMPVKKVNAAVNTYSGTTIIFHDDKMYQIVHENGGRFYLDKTGFIADLFPEIPNHIDSVFRFTNGMLYFFRKHRYFEFNEFTNTLSRAAPFDPEIFGIQCPSMSLFEQLRGLLQKLVNFNEPQHPPEDDEDEE